MMNPAEENKSPKERKARHNFEAQLDFVNHMTFRPNVTPLPDTAIEFTGNMH